MVLRPSAYLRAVHRIRLSLLAPFLLFAAAFLLYWQVGLMHSLLRWDAVHCFLAWRTNVSDMLREGALPLWSPWQHLGFPLHADPEVGAWYPVVWLFALVRGYDVYSLQAEWCLHVFIAGLGMYRLCRSLQVQWIIAFIAAVYFMTAGMFVSNAQNFIYLIGIAWFPWLLQSLLEWLRFPSARTSIPVALSAWMMVTGSYPGITIIAAYVLAAGALVWIIVNSRSFSLRAVWPSSIHLVVLTAGLCGAAVFSVWQVLPEISRAGGLGAEKILENPLPPGALISLFTPFAVGTQENFSWGSDFSMINSSAGLLTIAVLFSWILSRNKQRREWILLIATVLLFATAFGDLLPLRMATSVLPGMDLFRHPSIFRFFALFFLVLFAALSASRLVREESWRTIAYGQFAVIGVLVSLLLATRSEWTGSLPSLVWEEYAQQVEHSSIGVGARIAVHAAIQLVIILCAWYLVATRRPAWIALLVIIEAGISVQLNSWSTIVYPFRARDTQAAIDRMIEDAPEYTDQSLLVFGPDSLNTSVPGLVENQCIFLHLPCWDGYNSFVLNGYIAAEHSGKFPRMFDHPLVYAPDSGVVRSIHIGSNFVRAQVEHPGTVVLQQNYLPAWTAAWEGRSVPVYRYDETRMAVDLPAGAQGELEFAYRPAGIHVLAILCALSALYALLGLLIHKKSHLQ